MGVIDDKPQALLSMSEEVTRAAVPLRHCLPNTPQNSQYGRRIGIRIFDVEIALGAHETCLNCWMIEIF
jgi:hypothetical protein